MPERIGRFAIRGILGEGAFGIVYRGFDDTLGRDVAIKVPRTQKMSEGEIEAFLRDARAAAAIHHQNVCPVHEIGLEGGQPYIVLHLVAGPTLAEVIKQRTNPFPPRHAAAIVRKLALGVAAAHLRGVTHRDLKPGNVLVDGSTWDVLIADFGLALLADETRSTTEGKAKGTPAYMSPEQARGDIGAIGPHTDVYSLGVILYHLLTGSVPFQGSVLSVLFQAVHDDPRAPSELRPGIDRVMDSICLRAMAKSPKDRFASAKDLATALGDYLRKSDEKVRSSVPPTDVLKPQRLRVPPIDTAVLEIVTESRVGPIESEEPEFEIVGDDEREESRVAPPPLELDWNSETDFELMDDNPDQKSRRLESPLSTTQAEARRAVGEGKGRDAKGAGAHGQHDERRRGGQVDLISNNDRAIDLWTDLIAIRAMQNRLRWSGTLLSWLRHIGTIAIVALYVGFFITSRLDARSERMNDHIADRIAKEYSTPTSRLNAEYYGQFRLSYLSGEPEFVRGKVESGTASWRDGFVPIRVRTDVEVQSKSKSALASYVADTNTRLKAAADQYKREKHGSDNDQISTVCASIGFVTMFGLFVFLRRRKRAKLRKNLEVRIQDAEREFAGELASLPDRVDLADSAELQSTIEILQEQTGRRNRKGVEWLVHRFFAPF